jgi:hypothetical protein
MACVCRRPALGVAQYTRPRAAGVNFPQTNVTINDNLFQDESRVNYFRDKSICHNFNRHKPVTILTLKIKMSHRSWVHALLQRTGISQADLAGFLDVSRSSVAMACANERDLPNEARWQLYKIEQAMETLPPGPASPFTSYAPLIK